MIFTLNSKILIRTNKQQMPDCGMYPRSNVVSLRPVGEEEILHLVLADFYAKVHITLILASVLV